jgi:hypothetical protein
MQANGSLPLLLEGATQTAILNGPARFPLTLSVAAPLGLEAGRFFYPARADRECVFANP